MKKKLTPKSCGHNSVPLHHFQSYRIILRSVDTIVYPHTNQYPTLYTEAFTQRLLHTKLLPTEAFTYRRFYTQMFLHTDAFTRTLLHTDTFTHKHFYTQTFLHTGAAFTHKRFDTQKLLHIDAFTHRSFYTQSLLHTDAFRHIAILLQFLAIQPHFVRKGRATGLRGTS